MTPLDNLDRFEDLLDDVERARPGVIFVGSSECCVCQDLRDEFRELAAQMHHLDIYDLIAEDFGAQAWNGELKAVFDDIHLKEYPSQILLPRKGKPWVHLERNTSALRAALMALN
ncbi:hypothetical protein [Pantoea sp. Cy-639]|uniref:hypothetical protein n=1 Tax=Pantoea sp. Cy-639 TaxID=2608360 RepID=UPI0014243A61|nr:hypothetical protein [Pantoea sp. Cy-639]NIF17169.1 hypothetical protein [Pantoea sp. Cy-639]